MKHFFEDKWEGISCVMLVILALFCTFFFAYGDQLTTVGHSIIFIENILKGNLVDSYQAYIDLMVSDAKSYSNFPMAYSAMTYLIVGVVNLPLVIIHMTRGLTFYGRIFNTYVQFEHAVLLILCIIVFGKICKELGFNIGEIKKALFLFASSIYILCFVLMVGQMEIYVTLFTLLGILYWLKEKEPLFLLFFAIAIPLKLFALFILIPLLLIREKNIWRIILRLIFSIGFLIIEKLIFASNDAYRLSTKEPGIRMINTLSNNSITGGMLGIIPVFVVLYALLCIYIYCRKVDEDKFEGIYYCFVAYSLVFILLLAYPYWIVVLTPFIPLLIMKKKYKGFPVVLEMITSLSYIVLTIYQSPHIIGPYIVDKMCLSYFFTNNLSDKSQFRYSNPLEILKAHDWDKYGFLFTAVFIAGTIALMVLLRPDAKEISFDIGIKEKWLFLFRPLLIVPVMGITLFCYYGPKDIIAKNATENGIELCGWDLFSDEYVSLGDNGLVQILHFDHEYDLNEIDIMFQRNANLFYVYGSITLELRNDSSGEMIYSKRMGYNELKMGDYTRFKLKNILVNSEDEYSISISADYPQTETLQIYCSSDDILPNDVLYYGDELVGRDLGMIIKANAE